MGRLIYLATMSLDGFVADERGNFDFTAPDEQVHQFINDAIRPVRTFLFGRRMYETMVYWETADDPNPVSRDFAGIWHSTDKVVFSRTLDATSSARTRVEREFDVDRVRRLKASETGDISIGGAELAGQAIRAGLVDELMLFAVPVVVGGGRRAVAAGTTARLELKEERRFDNGTVYLRYGVRSLE